MNNLSMYPAIFVAGNSANRSKQPSKHQSGGSDTAEKENDYDKQSSNYSSINSSINSINKEISDNKEISHTENASDRKT